MHEKLQMIRNQMCIDRPLKQIGETTDHVSKGAFATVHQHFTAAQVEILHLGCNLFHPETADLPCTITQQAKTQKHVILFLAANPLGIDRRALDREARVIQAELDRSGHRECFEFVTRWAAEPLDLLRELRTLKPTIVHFSGHDGPQSAIAVDHRSSLGEQCGLYFQKPDGSAQLVPTTALGEAFGAAGKSVKVVVLSACYSGTQADALLAHVGCVVGTNGSISGKAATSFAIGFYGGLGERQSIAAAYKQGCAAISLEGLPDGAMPQLKVRGGIDADILVLAAEPLIASRLGTTAQAQPFNAANPMTLTGMIRTDAAHRNRARLMITTIGMLLALVVATIALMVVNRGG